VPVVFGPKWSAAIPIVQILCVLGIMRSLNNPVGSLILTKGKVEMSFYWNLSMSIVSLIVFWAIAPYGLQVLAWSVVAVFGVMMLLSWKSYYYDTVGMQWTVYCRVLLQPLLFSAAMAVSVYALRLTLAGRVASDILQLVILVSVGGVIYTGLHLAFARDYLRHLWKTIRGGS
jgi:teichuronic acid exporter